MKFKDFKYERVNYEKAKVEFEALINLINNSKSYEEQLNYINKINEIRNTIQTMENIASIRYDINTEDKFYIDEREFWDNNSPLFEELNSLFYKTIVNSKFKQEIIDEFGLQFYNICEYSLKSFSSSIIEDLKEENKLCSQYTRLLASAKIDFEGQERNLSGLGPFMLSKDRKIREKASKAYYNFFEENENKFDDLYDKFVKVRHKIAKTLGFENFVELGYIRMMRTDYNKDMVVKFREQVLEYIVPSASNLYKRQKTRLGIDELRYFDENFEFESGNATPIGTSKEILDNGKKMYNELSKQTAEFFEFMIESELMDVENKKGKSAGGYCNYIPNYKAPFIFSNFNGTSDDIDVLTHEAGHALQVYMSRWISMPELNFPTYESCEIHSMSMEFITWPWMNLFFKDQTDKYKFTHLGSAIKFIPYGVLVDEFQHVMYEQPNLTTKERKEIWRDLEKKYQPHKNYEECDILQRGGWWFKQGHIFKNPFYYIDYTLAQICALQFWKKMRQNKENGWSDYIRICEVGGTKSFLELVKLANLNSPFEAGCVAAVIGEINNYLESIDDKLL